MCVRVTSGLIKGHTNNYSEEESGTSKERCRYNLTHGINSDD